MIRSIIVILILILSSAAMAGDGFVRVEDGHFHRDGQRVRLWGINLVNEYELPKEQQVLVLDRLKALGFNALRLHQMDWYIVPDGDPGYNINAYVKGDNSPMDLMDHMIAAAIERGFVLSITLDRRNRPFLPDAYNILPAGDDEKAWRDALWQLSGEGKNATDVEDVWPIDARLEAAVTAYATNLLKHRNQYTGRTYAEEPGIAMWELANETNYIEDMVNGESPALKGYYGVEAQRLWNEHLREKYKTSNRLRSAWGALNEGESLEDATVKLAPLPLPKFDGPFAERAGQPSQRIRDLLAFLIERYTSANDRVRQAMRRTAPAKDVGVAVTPIGFDSFYVPTLQNLYCASSGDVSIVGTYRWYRTYDRSDPLYPITSMLSSLSLGALDMARVAGKPTVTYEFNVHKPAYYRAEVPMIVAAYHARQDWDGMFWYQLATRNSKIARNYEELASQPIEYSYDVNEWAGVSLYTDELMLASIRVAGAMFAAAAIPPASDPARFVIGAEDLVWSYNDSNSWHRILREASWSSGSRIAFDLSRRRGETIPGSVGVRRSSPVRFDDQKRQMVIDTDRAKVFTGWPDSSELSFAGGVRVSGVEPGKFVAFALVAEDGKPISASKRLVLTLLGTGENTGFRYDPNVTEEKGWQGAKASIADHGRGPVQIERLKATVALPDSIRAGETVWFNVFPEEIGREPLDGSIEFDGKRPAAWAEIHPN
jgi:hypothetical protein